MKQVETYSFATKTKTKIPASELAPGMVQANVEGVGTVYVSGPEMDALAKAAGPGPMKELPDGFDRIAEATLNIIGPCLPWMDKKAWLEGFALDAHPVRELVGWMKVAFVFHELTVGRSEGPEVQRDVFSVCANTLTNGEQALETVQLSRISKARAKTCMQRMLEVMHGSNMGEYSQFWADQLDEDDVDVLVRLMDRGDE